MLPLANHVFSKENQENVIPVPPNKQESPKRDKPVKRTLFLSKS